MGSIQKDVPTTNGSEASHYGDQMEPIAIIGMATRFPDDSTSTENLWSFLVKGRNAHSEFPKDRINADGHYHPDPEHGGTFAVKGGHFLAEDPAHFDALFFSTTKTEVMSMDPQQRLILENVYQALENSGVPLKEATGSNTSVFVSGFNHDHLSLMNTDPETTMKYKPTGTTNSLLSNRVSWFFDFKGPSLTLDTACSSSMVAMHLACQSLRMNESKMAVVSGVTLISFPTDITSMGHHGFLSQDGRCFSFDHRANGYARGEGVGSVIVKRLSDAIRDGDTIRAVIRGTGVNQDGRTAGISLPSSEAQEILMKSVYANAGLDFKDTHMVEAHGTGTAAGDPLEASAIAKTFAARGSEIPLYVGAIKSCIGHLEGGAGIAGLIKSTLILENGIIPANSNFEKVNPKIPMKKWNIQFPLQNVPWPTKGLRRISVNSFGVGGTNGHAILDDAYSYLNLRGLEAAHNTRAETPTTDDIKQFEARLAKLETAPENETAEDGSSEALTEAGHDEKVKTINGSAKESQTSLLFPITSFDEEGVKRNASALAAYLKTIPASESSDESQYLEDLSYTLAKRRSVFPWRSFIMAKSVPELIQNLSDDQGLPKSVRVKTAPKIGFVFTGQGAQWYAMGRELMIYPVFRQSIEAATNYMKKLGAEWDLQEELQKTKENTRVHQSFLAHPSCVSLQVALVELLASWGVFPERVVGHSSGEIAAAFATSKLSREAAWKAGYFRGYVSAKDIGKKGAMMAIGLSATEIESYLKLVHERIPGEMIIACFNSPKNNTVSGDEEKIDMLKELLETDQVFARKLNVPNAYHSAHMKVVASEYLEKMGDLSFGDKLNPPVTAEMFSSVRGTRVTENDLDAAYWVENMVQPVRFTEAMEDMCFARLTKGQSSLKMNSNAANVFIDTIIELGPHTAMQSAIKEILLVKISANLFNYLPVLSRTSPTADTILKTVGLLASRGLSVDFLTVNKASKIPSKSSRSPKLLVQLPPYSFNHSERVWYESRLSKNYRLRKHPRHDLFGAPVSDWNAEYPKWRHILRISEQPWLRDHIVTGTIIYPGVGYLIAAIEASRQIADPKQKLRGFRLKDISLKRALIIPDTKEGVEISVSLTRFDESSIQPSATWKKFIISSYNSVGDDWIEHCTGYIETEYETNSGPIDAGLEAKEELATWQVALASAKERCTVPIDTETLYNNLVTAGLSFGPLFRNLKDAYGTTNKAGEIFGTIAVPDIAKEMPKNYTHSHLIHPATFDSCLHFFIASVMDYTGKKSLDRAMVPTFIKDVWVSADLDSKPGSTLHGHGKSTFLAYDKYQSDVAVWDGTTNAPRISIKGVRATPLDSLDSDTHSVRKLCHNIDWVADLDMLTPKAFNNVELTSDEVNADYRHWINKFQLATLLLVTDALEELKEIDESALEGHFAKYFAWMKQLKTWLEKDEISGMKLSEWQKYNENPQLKAELFKQVDEHNADGTLAIRMGSNISKMLRKQVDPLHLMFGQDDLLDRVYEQVVKLGDLPAYQKAYLEILRRNSTNLRILEVGAGTGSSSAAMLDTLAPLPADLEAETECCISEYNFTDISAGFFEKAKDKFKRYSTIMQYKTFNAENDAAAQGFACGSYDMVVAGNVIHATKDLRKTLSNIRKLLKPGGKLILHEGIRQDFLWSGLSFGQLPGWWMGVEPIRQWSPWIYSQQWHDVLKDAGFSGIDLNLADRADPSLHTQSLLIGTAIDSAAAHNDGSKQIFIVRAKTESPNPLADALKGHLEQISKTSKVSIISFMDLQEIDVSQAICVSTMELERPVLQNLTEQEFANIRKLIATCSGMLWITGDTLKYPELGLITGLTRTVRWERDIDDANLVTLSVSEATSQNTSLVQSIGLLYQKQFLDQLPLEKINGEYMLKDGIFQTARLVDAPSANEYLASKFMRPKPIMAPLSSAGRPVKLATASPGLLNMLEFVTDEVYDKPLAATQVEIDIKAVGLNFRDLMIAMGEHMAYSLGNEAGGIITRVGSGVTKFKPGDRVVYLCGLESTGCFHTFGRVDQNVVVHIPESMSYEIAAGLPCVYATVIYGLVDAGRLLKGEKILIHAAAGGVGQAAINYSKYVGAEIFCTVSTPEKRELLMNEYGIPADHIFSSRDLSFVKGILRMTNNKGVDLVLNSLAGEALRRSWDLLAPFGRFVEIGKKDAQLNGKVDLHPFLRNVTMTSVELPTMMRHRPELIARLTEDTVRLYAEGHIREAKPTTVMNFSQIEEGLRILQSGKGTGKMIFVPNPDDVVPIVPQQPPEYDLRSDATYLMGGGLGGIGRSLGLWMVKRGARNLVFLSRSGKITESVQEMIDDLESKGCTVRIFTCDVSDKARVAEVLEDCKRTLPPIKGCVQGAMTLKDGMFENMSYEAWQTAVKPKVQGSQNLHELLPRDLDFFLLLSSATGVLGNRSQANYAAGNTYQDALARHRQSLGLPASTIDLGTVLSVGYVAENLEKTQMAKHLGTVLEVIREDEVHALIEYLMDPRSKLDSLSCQLVSGLTDASVYKSRGVPAPTYLNYPLFTHLRTEAKGGRAVGSDSDPGYIMQALLQEATSLDQAAKIISDGIRAKLSSLLAIPLDNIDAGKSVSSNGVDSLVAMEFRAFLAKELGADIPLLDIMGTASISVLSQKITSASKLVSIEASKPAAQDTNA